MKKIIFDKMNEYELFAASLAEQGGEIIKKYFRKPVSIDSKPDHSPVTDADRQAEELMRAMIRKHFPDHGIIGEEYGEERADAEYVWVLDPIDGTKSFICGALSFGTLIALKHRDTIELGVFHQPILKEMLIGNGAVTLLNGVPVRVRHCPQLSDAVLLTTDHLNIGTYQDAKKFDSLIRSVKLYRNWGDCYGYYLFATGFADIMIDPIMSLWDTCALLPIVTGAGGIITDYHGGDAMRGNSIVAAAPEIHQQVITMLNG